jgi:GH25 family lysozyme M1 (1,4-beta-N-acetylmuramidase)
METAFEYLPTPHSYQQEVLQEMYESDELFNEGLPSFEYLLYMDDEELDYFLGRVFRSVAKAAGSAAKVAGGVAKTVGKGLSAVDKIVPISVLTSGLAWTPVGMAVRAGLGAAQAAASGKNVLQGAVRSLASTPVTRFYVDTALAAARGENVLKAVQKAAQGQIGDFRQSLQFAAMVAPFVPGLGTGVAAALGAANALAAGQPINDALIAAARSAIPGGAVAQIAFDTATNLVKGKSIGDSLLSSARAQIPGGPAAQAAFDAAVALAKGKNIQDAAFAATGRLLPPSPYAADALSFVKKVASGQNIQKAALSTVGSAVLNKIEQQAGPIISRARAAVPINIPQRLPVIPTRFPRGLPQMRFPIRRELMEEITTPLSGDRFRQLVRSGQLTQAITEAVRNGVTDLNRLTDMVFYARHPEVNGRRLRPDEHSLTQEWLQIRAAVVQPALSRFQSARTPFTPAPATIVPTGLAVQGAALPTVLGLDTYAGDGLKVRDWARAKSETSISFALFRSNDGASADPPFRREWQRMKDAGIVRGAYLFLYFGFDPIAQATAVTKTLPLGLIEPGDFPPTLDIEFPGGRLRTGMTAQQCLDHVRKARTVLKNYYGVAPMIYTSQNVWNELSDPLAPDLSESPLWVKDYPFNPGPPRLSWPVPPPRLPRPWQERAKPVPKGNNWWIHQYQGDAIGLPGFSTAKVDMNRFNTMVRGEVGDRVKWVQARLGIAQSGVFDASMEIALRAFQRSKGLVESSIIDPRTFAYLCWSNP